MTNFEDLSDEIIISIIEYLPLEDFITMFGKLNARLAYIVFDHPWTNHQLNLKLMDNKTVQEKLDFIQNMKLTSKLSSFDIQPYSIFRTIETFNTNSSIDNFVSLRALSLNNITLDEAEIIFTPENLSKLTCLTRLHVLFSHSVEAADYAARLERLVAQILTHPTLRHCIIHTARWVNFTELKSPSPVEYLDINCCSFQNLNTLFEFTPSLKHLTAAILLYSESKIEKITQAPLLNSLKLTLSIPAWDDLTSFIKRFPKLQKLHIITYSAIEPITYTSTWSQLITEHLQGLIKFKRELTLPLENIEEYMEHFRWPNGWQFKEKSDPKGSFSRVTIVNIRY